MTVSLAQIVNGLESQLAIIDGLRIFDHVPGTAEYPAAFILPPAIEYRRTMIHGVIELELEIVILVSAVADRMQKDLFDYADWSGAKSIFLALDTDKTLGLSGINAVPFSYRNLALEEVAAYQAWGGAVRVVINQTA